ncbi:MAG: ATP-binding cassette domain-containing protein [Clostridia bacterium]|nr:ATP-binding cassette domain-containing protein [Clostridia bacterium]
MKRVAFRSIVPLIREAFENGKTITISVTGTSMTPTLDPRDAVVLQDVKGHSIQKGDILLYRRESGQYVLHRVVNVTDEYLDFCGDAQVYLEKHIPKSAVIARVCSYEKNGKTVSLEMIRKQGKRRLLTRPFRRVVGVVRRQFIGENGERSMAPTRYIWSYVKRHIKMILMMCLLAGITAACTLGMAITSGHIIDKAFYNDMQHFLEWFLVLFILLIVSVVSNFIYSHLRAKTIARLKNEMRESLFKELLTKQYRSVQEMHSGDILNRFSSDITLIADSAVSLIPQSVSLAVRLLGGISFMLFVDTVFTLIVVVGGVVLATMMQLFSRVYKKLHKECQETEGKARSFLQECVENLVVVKSFSNEEDVVEKLDEIQESSYKKQVRRNLYSGIGNMAVYSGFTLAYYMALAWGILRVAGRFGTAAMMSLGTFTTFLQIMEQIRNPFRSASGILPQYYSMLASTERLQELTLLPNDDRADATGSAKELYERMKALHICGVTFAYEDEKPILSNLDLSFDKNALTAIVGPSGAGKTTMIKLLLGLIVPQDGEIVLETDSTPVTVNATTRHLFAFVPQGNMILSGTIAENIRFGNRDVSDERLKEVCRLSCLEKTVRSLPHGLNTMIGERGFGLSEGQIQRLAIARALASDSPILLLDECTSALDMETEKQLIRNLKALDNRTILFISHRTAVLDNADAIVRLDDPSHTAIH